MPKQKQLYHLEGAHILTFLIPELKGHQFIHITYLNFDWSDDPFGLDGNRIQLSHRFSNILNCSRMYSRHNLNKSHLHNEYQNQHSIGFCQPLPPPRLPLSMVLIGKLAYRGVVDNRGTLWLNACFTVSYYKNTNHIKIFPMNCQYNDNLYIYLQSMNNAMKYDKIQHFINLPQRVSLAQANKNLFQKNIPTEAEAKFINQDIKIVRDDLITKIERDVFIFADTNYQFKFPESKFPSVPPGQRNNISYEQKVYGEEENTFADRLTQEQIEQIKEKGEFEVKSKSPNATIPYVWKINDCLLKGRVNRVNIWEEGLVSCYSLMRTALQFLVETIPSSIKQLALMPVKFFSLIFGKKKLSCIYNPDYQREVYKDFWTDIFSNQLSSLKQEIGHEFLQCLFIQYEPALYKELPHQPNHLMALALQKQKNEKIDLYNIKKNQMENLKSQLRTVENQFQTNWVKIRKNVLNKISSEIEQYKQKSMVIEGDEEPLSNKLLQKKDQTILQKFHEEKYLIYTAHLKENLPKLNISKNVIEALVCLIVVFSLVESKIKVKSDRLREIETKIREKVRSDHSILSRNYGFVEKAVREQFDPISQQVENQFFNELLNDVQLLRYFNDKYKMVYTKYVNLRKNLKFLVDQKKKSLKLLYTPQRTFQSFYVLFPPYEVVQTDGYYSLKKEQKMQVDTSTHFWKCLLYGMRLKCWSINLFKVMVGLSWASPLGFRCLCGIEDFAYDEYCDSSTGRKTEIKRSTLLGVFRTVLKGIEQSRNAFEALPDLGLFGKNCSRICNYLQCYVFRFFIVGVIGVLMLYPVAIILFSTICLLIGITFWIWVPLAMVMVYLFNILVFQFEVSFLYAGCLIRGIPLLSLAFRIIFHILKILASILFLLIIAPLICLLYIIFLILQRLLRTFTDTIIICFVGCCGRTPSTDTAIAHKISGPGMSRSYFYSIRQEDVYILTQAALQKILMEKILSLTRQRIDQNLNQYNMMCGFVFKPFGYSRPTLEYNKDVVSSNTSSLRDTLYTQSSAYMNRYPKNPNNVRFTQQEIELYFENTTKIVRNFVQKYRLQDWIFEQNQLLYEDYDELSRKIWIDIFGCGQLIFEPLEKLDTRFKLVNDTNTNQSSMKESINQISRALEGEVKLTREKINFNPATRSLLEKDEDLSYIEKICTAHTNNSSLNLWLSVSDPTSILIPPRNLESLKEYDRYQYDRLRRNGDKIIEI